MKKDVKPVNSLPKSITIFGRSFRIVEKPHLKDEDGKELCGLYDSIKREIKINSKDLYEVRLSTLRHEVVHALLDLSGLNEILSVELEEAIVRCIENGWDDLGKI